MAFAPRINNAERRDAVLFIYRPAASKCPETILAILAAYKKLRPQTKVRAFGFAAWHHPLVDEYFIDPSTETIPDLYSGSDFYVTAGRFEGSPLPPLEAMACGCIPVASKSGVLDYLRNRRNGLIFDHKKPEAVAATMADVIANDERRRAMIRNGLLTARERPMEKLFAAFESGIYATG